MPQTKLAYCDRCNTPLEEGEPTFLREGRNLCRACHDEVEPHCPSCGVRLRQRPKRGGRCPACEAMIVVRPSQHIYRSMLLNEDQVEALENLRRLKTFGVTEPDFRTQQEMQRRLFGIKPKPREVIWGLVHYAALLQRGDIETLAQLCQLMADLLREEGRDPMTSLRNWAHLRLTDWKETGLFDRVRIIANPDACEPCRRQAEQSFTIDEALERLPVPCAECTHKQDEDDRFPTCRCDYSPVVGDF